MNQQQKLPIYKITIIGDPNTGKTSLLQRQLIDKFYHVRMATIICDFQHKTYDLDFMKVKVQFWDTAGQQRFTTLPALFYKSYWMNQLAKYQVPNQKVYLIGCKSDLDHQVTPDQIKQFCEPKNIKYFQTSSLTGEGVHQAFKNIIIGCAKKQLILQNQQNLKLHANNTAPRRTCC